MRMTRDRASKAARRFSVERTESEIVLADRRNPKHTVEVRRALVHVTIIARVVRVCRSLVSSDGLERWLALEIQELSLGMEGDSSDLSEWGDGEEQPYDAENKIFGIFESNLEHVEITHARVLSLEARGRSGHRYVDDATDHDEDAVDDDDHSAVARLWFHSHADLVGDRSAALVLTVGFPEPQFMELMDACVSGRADTINLECRCDANTTGWMIQSARDLILLPGEALRLHIDEATMSGPVTSLQPDPALRAKRLDVSERPKNVDAAPEPDAGTSWPSISVGYKDLAVTVAASIIAGLIVGASMVFVIGALF
jgi:hypothetical protein